MANSRPVFVRPAADFGNSKKSLSISGWDNVIKNLSAECLAITHGSKEGLIQVAKHIRRDMEKNEPKVPFDLGNLDGSWTVVPITEGTKNGIMFGFSANYALWVHEMVDADFKSPRMRYGPGAGRKRWYTPRKGAGAKFFERALDRNHEQILSILLDKTKIK